MEGNLLEVKKAAELDRLGFQGLNLGLNLESTLRPLEVSVRQGPRAKHCQRAWRGMTLFSVSCHVSYVICQLNNIIPRFPLPLPQVTSPTPTTTTPLAGETLACCRVGVFASLQDYLARYLQAAARLLQLALT